MTDTSGTPRSTLPPPSEPPFDPPGQPPTEPPTAPPAQPPGTPPLPMPEQPPGPAPEPPPEPMPEPTREEDALEMEPTVEGEDFSRVAFTAAAVTQIQRLIDRNGPLMFHQSGGCCDGSSPMCYPEGDFITGDADVRMGHVEVPLPDGGTSPLDFWMSREQFTYWRHTHLTIDLVDGRGGGFSLESPDGKRFLTRSRMLVA